MAYRRSVALRTGVTKRQIWNRMIGDARTRPPKRAIFTRSDKPSRGDVTNRLQLPFDATKERLKTPWQGAPGRGVHTAQRVQKEVQYRLVGDDGNRGRR